jgi:predicted porin
MADTTLYGKLHASVGAVKTTTAGASSTVNAVESHSSRFGIKGATALDNGMEATYGLEYGLNLASDGSGGTAGTTDANSQLTARNTFVGVKGGFGEVRVGRHDTPAKLSTAGLDVFADTYADMSNIVATDSHRVDNAVAYINKFGPVGVAAAHSTAISAPEAGAGTVPASNNANTVMVNYSTGPWYAALGQTNVQNLGKTTNLGLGWKAEAGHNVSMVYETAKGNSVAAGNVPRFALGTPTDTIGIPGTDAAGNSLKDKNLYLAGGYKMGNVTLKAGYGTSKRSGDAAGLFNGTEKQTTLGADYSLGKKTSVYLIANDNKNTNHASGATLATRTKATAVGLVTEF